jgi:hypothetical protein
MEDKEEDGRLVTMEDGGSCSDEERAELESGLEMELELEPEMELEHTNWMALNCQPGVLEEKADQTIPVMALVLAPGQVDQGSVMV